MWQQKSFEKEGLEGALYLVPTPIGNLEDMSFRAIRIMKEADLIAAEDTRNTKKLCNYFEIDTPITSYHEHNKEKSGPMLLEKVKEGKVIALVSDAGMPIISDPGFDLVETALENRLTVIPLPGANAALTALVASGLIPQPFYFYGFLSRSAKTRKSELEELRKLTATFILYESPHRLRETLQTMLSILGNRNIVLCRELTKKYEEFIRGTIEEALVWAESGEVRGEFCVIVEGNQHTEKAPPDWWEPLTITEHVTFYINNKDMTSKEAIKQAAKDRNLQKRDVYNEFHIKE
ncbi:16S rRNA (cytidine(1402)-2'-O)-methyltransferase [Peribacillus sp. SCS-26]|uniref:16S rRNA (cytidine(1402)-2'-O)-methyltransferase n=1 Tax=Paraperibacillus marinus TaxID=3115295 RepID=UPI00390656AC